MKKSKWLFLFLISLIVYGCEPDNNNTVAFGLVTDVHYSEVKSAGTRYYSDSYEKLSESITVFNELGLPFVVNLGDFINEPQDGSKEKEIGYLHKIRSVFDGFKGGKHLVLGNHCVSTLSKEEFLENSRAEIIQSYYSFNIDNFHFIVLDANFKSDGEAYDAGNFKWTDTWIPDFEKKWIEDDLKKNRSRKTIIFIHQNLHEVEEHGVKNSPEIRKILEESGNVTAVLQGHNHSGGYTKINGINYITFKAMVEGSGMENNSFAVVTVSQNGGITVKGYGKQESLSIVN